MLSAEVEVTHFYSTALILRLVPIAASEFLFRLFFSLIDLFFPVFMSSPAFGITFMGGFLNVVKSSFKRVSERTVRIISVFIVASKSFIFYFLRKKHQNSFNHHRLKRKY